MPDIQTPRPIELSGVSSRHPWERPLLSSKDQQKGLRIAQVSPLFESVPPKLYGGTERVVFHLTEELVKQGHEVTLFASADSQTSAHLVPCSPGALRLDTHCGDPMAHHFIMMEEVFRRIDEFDMIHFHIDYLHFGLSRRHRPMQVTTLHGRLDIADLISLYREFSEMPVVSISSSQRQPLRHANWVGTVHHGLPLDLYRPHLEPGSYLAFLGRISPEKRVDRAIEIALASEMPLKIAAKVDNADKDYFCNRIRPLLDHPLIEFLGEIGEREKNDFLGGAHALLFPIDWPEPFGLVMIEAMACGTPVIAWANGSIPEIIENGVSGFQVESINEATAAVRNISELSRRRCREAFEKKFSANRMAADYVSLYGKLLSAGGRAQHLRVH